MAFEKFTNKHAHHGTLRKAPLYSNGRINFGVLAVREFAITEAAKVSLFYDRETHRVGMEFSARGLYKVIRGSGSLMITCTSFVRHIGLSTLVTAALVVEDGMLVAQLPEEPAS